MKKSGVLHTELSKIIAGLGHTQTIVIADYGLPVPPHVAMIDLAIRKDMPPFAVVLETILTELTVELATVAEELRSANPTFLSDIEKMIPCPLAFTSHEQFKEQMNDATVVVRTGEHSPYANVILRAGVVF